MKKTVSLLIALLMSLTLVLFVGCGEGKTSGVIKGNYKEATAEELQTAIAAIDEEKLFGDMSAADWALGVNLSESFAVNGKMGTEEVSLSSDGSYQISVAKKGTAFDIAGKGDFSLEMNVPALMPGMTAGESKMNMTVYNDMNNMYIAAKENGAKDEMKLKVDFDKIGGIGGMAAEEELPGGMVPVPGGIDLAQVLAMAKELGVKVEMDNANGLKLKVSADDAALNKIVEMIMGEIGGNNPEEELLAAEDDATVKSPVTFSKSLLEVYVHIDADGKLVAASINMDINFALDMTGLMAAAPAPSSEMNMSVKGALRFEVNNKTVVLPEGIATDNTYIDISTMM